MPTAKLTKPEIDKSLEMDMEQNVHELKRAGTTFRQTEDGNDEITANDLGILLGRVSEAARREIDDLIGELRGLRKKLETNCDHLQSDIAEYAKLGHAVMQVTAIISDGVKELPRAPRLGP